MPIFPDCLCLIRRDVSFILKFNRILKIVWKVEMSEWIGLVLVTALITAVSTTLLAKLLGPIKRKIEQRQIETQKQKDQRELYLKLLKMKNSRKRKRRDLKK